MSKYIFDWLKERIGNEIGVCALMGNLYVESHLNPLLLQGSYARKWGIDGEEYARQLDAAIGDDLERFYHDGAGFGLAQWTYWSRKKGLVEYARKTRRSIGNLDAQLEYLWIEIQTYKTVIRALMSATDLRECSDVVALRYERPQHTEEKYLANRAKYGQQFYDAYANQNGSEKGETDMNSAAYVDQKINEFKSAGISLPDAVWKTAELCLGWPYIFGDRGQYCTSSHRQAVYNSHPSYTTLISKCQVLKGSKSSCSGCQWYPGGQRVRGFDCRGFTYWCLLQFGIKIMGAGATSQWNDDNNWEAKGTIDTIPDDKLVCLFYPEKKAPNKMAHTGFGYKGQTLECSSGVQYFKTRNKKWTHWAIPKGLYDGGIQPSPSPEPSTDKPTLRKGDKGSYVTLLQTELINRGYSLPKYGADGSFGNETLTAVKQFQKDHGLTTDGVVGAKTWAALEESPEKQKLYTVTIPHLSREAAEELLKKYPGQMVLEE